MTGRMPREDALTRCPAEQRGSLRGAGSPDTRQEETHVCAAGPPSSAPRPVCRISPLPPSALSAFTGPAQSGSALPRARGCPDPPPLSPPCPSSHLTAQALQSHCSLNQCRPAPTFHSNLQQARRDLRPGPSLRQPCLSLGVAAVHHPEPGRLRQPGPWNAAIPTTVFPVVRSVYKLPIYRNPAPAVNPSPTKCWSASQKGPLPSPELGYLQRNSEGGHALEGRAGESFKGSILLH